MICRMCFCKFVYKAHRGLSDDNSVMGGPSEMAIHDESMLANTNGCATNIVDVFWCRCFLEVCEILEVQGQRFGVASC